MKRVLNLKQLRLGVLASVVVLLCATPLAQSGEGHSLEFGRGQKVALLFNYRIDSISMAVLFI